MRNVSISLILPIFVLLMLRVINVPNLVKIGPAVQYLSISYIINEIGVNMSLWGAFFNFRKGIRDKGTPIELKSTKNKKWAQLPI